jgi:hypothetical protein
MNKSMNSTRCAFSLSSNAVLGWGGAVATLPRDAMAQAPADLDSRVKAFLDQRRNTWSQGINYWNVRYEDGQALHDLLFQDADNVLRPAAREVTQFVEAARRDPAFRKRIVDLGIGEGELLACRN